MLSNPKLVRRRVYLGEIMDGTCTERSHSNPNGSGPGGDSKYMVFFQIQISGRLLADSLWNLKFSASIRVSDPNGELRRKAWHEPCVYRQRRFGFVVEGAQGLRLTRLV